MTTYYGHRITEYASQFDPHPDAHNALTPDQFEQFLERHKDEANFQLTFDDGYVDNLQYLLPILESHNIPATIFITTGFITRETLPFEYCLADAIAQNDTLRLPDAAPVDIADPVEKYGHYHRLRNRHKWMPHATHIAYLDAFNRLNTVDTKTISNLFLSWEALRELAQHPLITIGAHGHTHRPLRWTSPYRVYREMADSKKILEQHLDMPITAFAYPYGSCNIHTHLIGKWVGYDMLYTTNRASLFPWVYPRKEMN